MLRVPRIMLCPLVWRFPRAVITCEELGIASRPFDGPVID